ncbi:hypothetical protein RYX36_021324 [Vicia faba]
MDRVLATPPTNRVYARKKKPVRLEAASPNSNPNPNFTALSFLFLGFFLRILFGIGKNSVDLGWIAAKGFPSFTYKVRKEGECVVF